MRPHRQRFLIVVITLAATAACAPARVLTPRELRQSFGTIAVTTGGAERQHGFQQPITSAKEGAAVGAGAAAAESAHVLMHPVGLLFLPLLPLAVGAGAIAGAARTESPEIVATGTAALNAAMEGFD